MPALAAATLIDAFAGTPAETRATLPQLDPPAGERAAAAFFRALPCAGWAAREICRQRPALPLEAALRRCLEALRACADELAQAPAFEFEERALGALQQTLAVEHGELEWELPAPPTPAPDALTREPIVLLVEDCPLTRGAIAAHLRRANWDVRVAADGAAALVLASVIQPDLVLLGGQPAGLDALRVAQVLQETGLADEPAVVFLADAPDRAALARMTGAGACDVLERPFAAHRALPRLRAQLELRQLRRQVHAANNRLHKIHLTQWHALARLGENVGAPLAALRTLAEQLAGGAFGPLDDRQAAAARDLLGLAATALGELDALPERATAAAARPSAAATPAWIFGTAPGLIPFTPAR